MTFRGIRTALATASLLAAAAPALCTAAPGYWRAVDSDMPVDPALTRGVLDNGLQFEAMRHPYPQNRVSVRLVVASGSRDELDDERGVAHLVEHMAFRGTKAMPNGALAVALQKLGISIGPDSGAFTSYDNTIYLLELPNGDAASLASALQIFREIAENVTFDPEALDLERRVVLNEKSLRSTPEFREREFNRLFLWPDARELKRITIGSTEIVRTIGRDRIVSYYNALYRPERMAVVVTGDIDSAVAIGLVREAFGDLRGRGEARPEPAGQVAERSSPDASHVYKEAAINGVLVVLEHPYESKFSPDTAELRRQSLQYSLAVAMFQARMRRNATGPDATVASPEISTDGPVRDWGLVSFTASSRLNGWRDTLRAMDHSLRQALEFGFNPGELKQAKAGFANGYEQAARSADTRHAAGIAGYLVNSLLYGNPVVTPAALRDEMTPQLAAITLEDCNAAFRSMWEDEAPKIFIGANAAFDAKPEDVSAVLAASRTQPVIAAPDIADAVFAYDNFGPAGRVERHQSISDLGIELGEFANGTRMNVKQTSYEKDAVTLTVRVGYGRRTQPLPGMDLLSYAAFLAGGLNRNSLPELGTIIAGKSVSLQFSVDDDALVFSARTSTRDLEFGLRLIAAYMTDPAYRADALGEARVTISTAYGNMNSAPGGQILYRLDRLLSRDDRFGIPEPEQLSPLSLEQIAAWIDPQLKRGPVEVALVGDVTWDDAAAAVGRTLGALPDREPRKAVGQSIVVIRPAAGVQSFINGPQVGYASSVVVFPAGDVQTARQERACALLASIMQEMLRVSLRENLGATYSPTVTFSRHRAFPGFAYFMIATDTLPADFGKLPPIIMKLYTEIRKNGVPEEVFDRVVQTVRRDVEDDSRTNGYWLGNVLASLQQYPENLMAVRSLTKDYEAITRAELQQIALRYLQGVGSHSFVALPPVNR